MDESELKERLEKDKKFRKEIQDKEKEIEELKTEEEKMIGMKELKTKRKLFEQESRRLESK